MSESNATDRYIRKVNKDEGLDIDKLHKFSNKISPSGAIRRETKDTIDDAKRDTGDEGANYVSQRGARIATGHANSELHKRGEEKIDYHKEMSKPKDTRDARQKLSDYLDSFSESSNEEPLDEGFLPKRFNKIDIQAIKQTTTELLKDSKFNKLRKCAEVAITSHGMGVSVLLIDPNRLIPAYGGPNFIDDEPEDLKEFAKDLKNKLKDRTSIPVGSVLGLNHSVFVNPKTK